MLVSRYPEPSTGFSYKTLEQSTALPVNLSEVKDTLNLSSDAYDSEILDFLKAAVRDIERFTGKTIVKKTYEATWSCMGDYTDLLYGPIISVDSVERYIGTDIYSYDVTEYYRNVDRLNVDILFSTSTYGRVAVLKSVYTAGMLIPVSVLSNVFTLVGHGYVDGDTISFTGFTGINEGQRYTVESATDDTFEIGETITDGDGFIGILEADLKASILLQASKNYLRGEASTGLSKDVQQRLIYLRDELDYP